jgi:hypothetical protein
MQVTCPICDEAVATELWKHVWLKHVPVTRCWCGEFFSPRGGSVVAPGVSFEEHLAGSGGVLVHYLECRLGCKN